MEHLIQKQAEQDRLPETNDNQILKELDEYLNSKFETDREDYEEVSSFHIPNPVLKENNMWTIPGTTREYPTEALARRAIRRYVDYQVQNEASMVMYGVTYNEYVHGAKNESTTQITVSQSGEGNNGPGNIQPNNTGNDPIPETPADYTTVS